MTATCKYMNSEEAGLQTTGCPQICRKTRHRLPSGFGTVRFLGKGRRRPYAVHPPAKAVDIEAADTRAVETHTRRIWRRPPAICYVSTREIGRRILRLYHAGEYWAGIEKEIEQVSAQAQIEDSATLAGQAQEKEPAALEGQAQIEDPATLEGQAQEEKLPALPAGPPISDALSPAHDPIGAAPDTAGRASDLVGPPSDPVGPASDALVLVADADNQSSDALVLVADADNPSPDALVPAPDAAGRASGSVRPAPDTGGAGTPAFPAAVTPAAANSLPESSSPAPEPAEGSFARAYAAFYEYKFGTHASKKLSKSTRNATNAAYKKFAPLYHVPVDDITVDDLQDIINGAADDGYSKSAVRQMVTLTHQLYKYAFPRELCKKDCGRYVEMPGCTAGEEHHQDFTDEELEILWKNYRKTGDPIVRMILVMCYSGFRIGEYEDSTFRICLPEEALQSATGGFGTMKQKKVPQPESAATEPEKAPQPESAAIEPNKAPQLESATSRPQPQSKKAKKAIMAHSSAYFQGGLKTEAGRNRIVPIHSAILPLVLEMLDPAGKPVFFCGRKSGWFRRKMKEKLTALGIDTAIDAAATPQTPLVASPQAQPGASIHAQPSASPQARPAASPHTLRPAVPQDQPAVRIHTPHSTRHTFSRLCESYGVGDADRRRMLGHSFGSDITNGVYGHRSVEELRRQIEKITVQQAGAR